MQVIVLGSIDAVLGSIDAYNLVESGSIDVVFGSIDWTHCRTRAVFVSIKTDNVVLNPVIQLQWQQAVSSSIERVGYVVLCSIEQVFCSIETNNVVLTSVLQQY